MKRKFLITTLVSISLLSLNLFAGTNSCSDGFCMVDLSKNSPSSKKQEESRVDDLKEKEYVDGYKIIMVDNIETIIFPHSQYVMNDLELAEYDLDHMQELLLTPVLDSEDLPTSDYFCEDDLKPVVVVGMEDTYECT